MRPPLLLAAISALALSSCFSPGDGLPPPLNSFYFPTGVVLDTVTLTMPPRDLAAASRLDELDEDSGKIKTVKPAPKYLYVASSDFDLQYRSSSLASFDLDQISTVVPRNCASKDNCLPSETCDTTANVANGGVPSFFCVSSENDNLPCGNLGEHTDSQKLLYPGRCNFIDPVAKNLLVASVGIGAFATDVIIRANPTAPSLLPARLFLPVRGDATLHWIDLDAGGVFHCGQSNTDDDSCDSLHRAGNQADLNPDQIIQPSEPFAIDATSDGTYVVVTNQTTGSVSLFVHRAWASGPVLESIATGLPSAPVGIASIPDTLPASTDPPPGFLVAYRNAAQIDLLRLRVDSQPLDPSGIAVGGPRYVLTPAASAPINANSLGFDSRGIVIDDAQRLQDYAACPCAKLTGAALTACQATPAFLSCAQLAHQPDVYVANRAPSSLLVGHMTPDLSYANGTSELPSFIDSIALTLGPSRVVLGYVKVPTTAATTTNDPPLHDSGGLYDLERRVFVVCFDSRRIFVYDPVRRVIEAIITTGRGPFALAIDQDRGLAYVAHFTDSYLGVISLDQRFPQTYASIVASIGPPSPPRASK